METVLCKNCNHHFTFDPKRIWTSPINAEAKLSTNTGIVLVPCPKCESLRTFLVDPEKRPASDSRDVSPRPADRADSNNPAPGPTSAIPPNETQENGIAAQIDQDVRSARERLAKLRDELHRSQRWRFTLQKTMLVQVKRQQVLLAQIRKQLHWHKGNPPGV